MRGLLALLTLLAAFAAAAIPASAQADDGIQLRLTNRMTSKVDYYVTPQGGKARFVGSVEAGKAVDVEAQPGQKWTFAVDRAPFQTYTTRTEPFQNLTLAPKGQQQPPIVAIARQKPLGGGSIVTEAPVVETPRAAEAGDEAAPQTDGQTDGFVWTFSQFQDAKGIDTSILVFGLPETDGAQFSATCSAAPGGGVPQALVSANVSRFKPGSAAKIRFMAPGFSQEIAGKVVRSPGGQGQDGISIALATDHPLWQKVTEIPAISYSVQGTPPLRLPLTDIGPALDNFMRDCAQFGGGQNLVTSALDLFADEGGGAGAAGEGGGDTCRSMATARSTAGGKSVHITFVNRTNEFRVLDWIDFDGNPIEYAQLEGGQSFQTETSATHPWMVTDGPGNCIERFMPGPTSREIAITRASPGFGDE